MKTQVKASKPFSNKDFIRTAEGLYFAVVSSEMELDKIICNLRYITEKSGTFTKLSTTEAKHYLQQHYPRYLHYSEILQTHIHAVELSEVAQHYCPYERVSQLMQKDTNIDDTEACCVSFLNMLAKQSVNSKDIGLVGSLLIGAHGPDSDIDLVVKSRQTFETIRHAVQGLMANGEIAPLSEDDWQQSYARRDCSLSLADYIWHEERKFNKFMFRDIKFDLSCIEQSAHQIQFPVAKMPAATIEATLTTEDDIFSFPARYPIEHSDYKEVLCYTATYVGQVFEGETFIAQGPVETDQAGIKRIIIGTSREARNEFIRTKHAEEKST